MTIDDIRRLHAETLPGLPEFFRRWGKFDRDCVGVLLAEIDKLRAAERAAAERMRERCAEEIESYDFDPELRERLAGYIRALPLEEPTP